jgi:hypothetical protein
MLLGGALLALNGAAQRLELPSDIQKVLRDEYGNDVRFFAAQTDFNSDGRTETVVHVVGPKKCETAGCPTLIFTTLDDTHPLITIVEHTKTPIGMATNGMAGWCNLVVHIGGGGIKPADVELMYDGRHYPFDATAQTPLIRVVDADVKELIPRYESVDSALRLPPAAAPTAKSADAEENRRREGQ